MTVLTGKVTKKARTADATWLIVAGTHGETVVRVEKPTLSSHVADSVRPGDQIIVAGHTVHETGPDQSTREVLIAHTAGLDLEKSNAMVVDGQPRAFYVTNDLEITDTPPLTQQSLRFV